MKQTQMEKYKEPNKKPSQSLEPYFSWMFFPGYEFITFYANKSKNIPTKCSGNVRTFPDNDKIFRCENNDHCKNCDTFTVTGLGQNKKYLFDITENSKKIKVTALVSTLTFWIVKIKASNDSMDVTIINLSSIKITCKGTIKDSSTGKTVYSCDRFSDCGACKSFKLNNLVPDTWYAIRIITNYSRVKIDRYFETLLTFYFNLHPSNDMIDVSVTRMDSASMSCKGYVFETKSMVRVFDCSLDKSCRTCHGFHITSLKQKTKYIINIVGDYKGVSIKTTASTTMFWDFKVKTYDNSIQLEIIKNSSIPIYCTGHIWNLNDSILIFNCSNDYFCQNCQKFTVYGLYANTIYEITVNSTKPDLNITVPYLNLNVNVTTTYHLSPIFIRNYTSISVVMNRSINLTAECHGNVYALKTATPLYTCEKNYYCRFCVNFTIFNMKGNQKYVFDIYSTPEGVFPQNLSTLNFWDVTTKSTLNSISVDIRLFSHIQVKCSGHLFDQKQHIIFDCSTDENCKKCHSFIIQRLSSNEDYILNITTNFSNVKFLGYIKTDRIFDVSTNISFFTMNVEVTKLKNYTTYCSGDIKLDGTNQTIFLCEHNDGCSSCENFIIDGLTENTKYISSIFMNESFVFLKKVFTTRPLWTTKFLTTSKSITVFFNRLYKESLFCYGTIIEVIKKNEVLNCTENANCSGCNTFELDALNSDTEYNINIKSDINHTGLDKIVRTKKLLEVNHTVTFNQINISIIRDLHENLTCSGNAYNNESKDVVFKCKENQKCKFCESFGIKELSPETTYVVELKVNDTGVSILLIVETDTYTLKVKKIISQLTSISVDIEPNYNGGGLCNLTLHDKLMDETNLTCSKSCPNDCDKLSFTIIDLDMNSDYTLFIANKFIQESFDVKIFTGIINFTLNLVYMSDTEFVVSPYANEIAKSQGVCNFTFIHLQTGDITYITNNCTNVEKYDIQRGESYKVNLISSLSTKNIEPLIVYTLPIEPKIIQLYQLNNTALDVKVQINVTQPAPIEFRIKLYDDQHIIEMIDSYISYKALKSFSDLDFKNFEAIVYVVSYILIKVGTCTFINTSFCLTAKEEYCSSCVYTRVPIFYISFHYPGDVTLVSVGKNPAKLRMVLPSFSLDNKWTSKCSMYIAKLLHLNSLSTPLPDNFDINYDVYNGNIWALLYRSYSIVTCEKATNVTFGDQTDKSQLNLDFVKNNLYYAGVLQLCRHITCVSSKMSNIQFVLSQINLDKQYILFIFALILGVSILGFLMTLLVLRNLGMVHIGSYEIKSTNHIEQAIPSN